MSGSERFNSKKLTYDMEEPAFLRRLRQAQSGFHPRRDIAPRNKKKTVEDDEDAPTYVMEGSGESISAQEFKLLTATSISDVSAGMESVMPETEKVDDKTPETAADLLEETPVASKDNLLEAGVRSTKRKAMKVVNSVQYGEGEQDRDDERRDKKPKTKRKANQRVKLSFHDEDKNSEASSNA